MRVDQTPYGDGSRILQWLSFVQNSSQSLIEWNPYRNGGYPLFADAEQFWYLNPIIDTQGENANLQLNGALYALVLLTGLLAWRVARKCGLTPQWALVAALLICLSDIAIINERSARFAAFINVGLVLFALAMLLRAKRDLLTIVGLSVCLGLSLALVVQYSLPLLLAIYSVFLFDPAREGWRDPRHFAYASTVTFAIACIALALASIILVPMVLHLNQSYIALETVQYQPVLPKSSELAGLIFPYIRGDKGVFISMAVLPAIVLAACFGMPRQGANLIQRFSLVFLFAGFFLIMTLPLLGAALSGLWSGLPLLSSVRQYTIVAVWLSILVNLIAILVVQHHAHRQIGELPVSARWLLTVYFVISAFLAFRFAVREHEPVNAWIAVGVVAACGLAAWMLAMSASSYALGEPVKKARVGPTMLGLVAISIATLAAEPFRSFHPKQEQRRIHVTNQPRFPELFAKIVASKHKYPRVVSDFGTTLHLQKSVRVASGFSLYFPRGHAHQLNLLSTAHDIQVQRPHWVRRAKGLVGSPWVHCHEYDGVALELLGISHLLCKEDFAQKTAFAGFRQVGSENGAVLFERNTDDASYSPFKLFCRWRQSPELTPSQARPKVLDAFTHNLVLLEAHASVDQSEVNCPDDRRPDAEVAIYQDIPGRLELAVKASTAGYLLIPDNHASGWTATVDGMARPVLQAYFGFRAVYVPAGESQLNLMYRDRYLAWGVYGTLSALALLLLGLAAGAYRRISPN